MKPIRTLRQCLIDTELIHLRVVARLWGVELRAGRPLEIAAELAEALTDPAYAANTWETLPGDERVALTALLDAGGLMPTATFTRRFGEIRAMGPGRLERETPWRDPISPAEGLWYRGLIYEGFAGEGGETHPVFFVPAELRAALPVGVERMSATFQLEPASPPAYCRVPGDLLLDDLTTVLAYVHNEMVRPPVDTPGTWPEGAQRALVHHLCDPDAERLVFILHLIDHLGWMRLGDDGRLRLVAGPVTTWLQGTSDESRATLLNAWREVTDWNELWRLPSLRPDDTGTWRNDPTLARAALLSYLAALTPGQWVKMADFINAIKATDPDFQRPGGDYEAWYVRDAVSGAYLTGFESWDRVEGALLRALLTGPAWWLGLVELGSERKDAPPEVFRPTPAELSFVDPPPPVVHPDLTITMPAARRFERFQLARIADMVCADAPYVYRLAPASLGRARRQKIDLEKILGFLDGLSDAPLPKAVQSSVTRWAGRGTEVWLERTILLRVANEVVLRQIADSPQTGRYVERVVGPTAAVVAEKDWPRLVAAMAELGLLAELIGMREFGAQGPLRNHVDQ